MQDAVHITRAADARTTTTPNATMTTLASPTQGGTHSLALWRVTMTPGQRGPVHVFDSEQAWTVVAGAATIAVDGRAVDLHAGDTVVLPAGSERQIEATAELEAIVTGSAGATVRVPGEEAPRGTPPWIA